MPVCSSFWGKKSRFFKRAFVCGKYSEVGGGSLKKTLPSKETSVVCVCLMQNFEKKNNCYVTVNLLCILCATGMKGDIAKYSALLTV